MAISTNSSEWDLQAWYSLCRLTIGPLAYYVKGKEQILPEGYNWTNYSYHIYSPMKMFYAGGIALIVSLRGRRRQPMFGFGSSWPRTPEKA